MFIKLETSISSKVEKKISLLIKIQDSSFSKAWKQSSEQQQRVAYHKDDV